MLVTIGTSTRATWRGPSTFVLPRPEDWKGSSLFLREACLDEWLMSLRALNQKTKKRAWVEYRSWLYYPGGVPTKPGHAAIPRRAIKEEASRGFDVSEVYRKRMRYFVDGLAV